MDLKVSLDNITLTAYIKAKKLQALKTLIETHTAITVQVAMTDMFRAVTRDGGRARLLLDYDIPQDVSLIICVKLSIFLYL